MSYIFNAASQISDKRDFFFSPSFFWRIEITPHISLDTLQSLQSVVRWAICFIHVLWTSACPDVKNHQAPTGLPPETGCKWTRESRLKTTCQDSPAPDDSFTSSAEVSWEANSPQTEWLTSATDTFARGGCFFASFFCYVTFIVPFYSEMKTIHSGSSGVSLSKTGCVSSSQLLVDFDTAVHSGCRSTSLLESPEARANWRERVWPLTSAHWLIAATVCPTVFQCVRVQVRERKCACVSLYIIPLHTILFLTLHPSHRKCVAI